MELQCLNLFIMTKKIFWRISVKFHLWVPLKCHHAYLNIIIIIIIISVFCPRAGPSLQAQEPRLQFCRSQVFHRKLRNQGCSFTRDLIGAVASRCFPHPTPSSAFEETLKDLKRSQGSQLGGEECGIWLIGPSGLYQNSPQWLNISSIKVFDQIRDPEIPINLYPQDTQYTQLNF